MRRFLAIEAIPGGATPDTFRDALRALDRAADALGLRVRETIFNLSRGQAFSLFDAETEEQVHQAHEAAGFAPADVFPADVIYTNLLEQPRRAR